MPDAINHAEDELYLQTVDLDTLRQHVASQQQALEAEKQGNTPRAKLMRDRAETVASVFDLPLGIPPSPYKSAPEPAPPPVPGTVETITVDAPVTEADLWHEPLADQRKRIQSAKVTPPAAVTDIPVAADTGTVEPYTVTQLPDGTFEARLRTGETFKGNIEQVMKEALKSAVHSKEWGKQNQSEAERLRQQLNPAIPVEQPPAPDGDAAVGEYLSDTLVRNWGFNDTREAQQFVANTVAMAKLNEYNRVMQEFYQMRPNWPDSNEAISAIDRILTDRNLDFTTQNMVMAYDTAVASKQFEPLTDEQRRQVALLRAGFTPEQIFREVHGAAPVPPPTIPSNNPENGGAPDLWQEPLSAMRKRLLAEQTMRGR
jgi:hypothetical protein